MIDRTNRVVLLLLALLLIALGVVTLAAAQDLLTLEQPATVFDGIATAVQQRPELWWPVIIAATAVIAGLALAWAVRQVVIRRPGGALSTITLDDGDRGRTTVDAASIARVAAADLARLPQVTGSDARLVGNGDGRQLRTRVDVLTNADLAGVRAAADDVYARVADAIGVAALPAHTRIRPVGGPPPRVR